MEKLVYKYNGDTQIIRFNSAEKFNEYLVKNISEIESIEEVEVINLADNLADKIIDNALTGAPVEVEEAPVEAPKAEVIVKTFIEEFDFLFKDGRTDILEQITDWLMANVVDDELFIEYCNSKAVTTINDTELAKSILKDRGCVLEPPAPEMTFDRIIKFIEEGGSDSNGKEAEYLKNWILDNCISDQDIQSEFEDRDLEIELSEDEIINLADQNGLTIINDEELAIDYLSDEGYACLNTANEGLKDNIAELINFY